MEDSYNGDFDEQNKIESGKDYKIDFSTVYPIKDQFPTNQPPLSKDIPTKDEAIELMRDLHIHQNIINHQLAVLREAREIAYNIKEYPVDLELVKAGAIIHDIGRFNTHGFHHGPIGADFLRYLGYPEKLARIVEKHLMAGLTKEDAKQFNLPDRDYIPRTIEEKIVCIADKYVMGTKKVTIRERFDRWFERYGENDFLQNQMQQARVLEEEILKLIF